MGHVIDVVEVEVILPVHCPSGLVCPDLPVAAQGPGAGAGDGSAGLQLDRGAAALRRGVSGAGAGGGSSGAWA